MTHTIASASAILASFPGPTDAARRIQQRQQWALDCVFEIKDLEELYESKAAYEATLAAARTAYAETVSQLEALLGPNAACAEVDIELSNQYSDQFKAENGASPQFHMIRQDVQTWLARHEAAAHA